MVESDLFTSKPKYKLLLIFGLCFILFEVLFLEQRYLSNIGGFVICYIGLCITTIKTYRVTNLAIIRSHVIPAFFGLMITRWDYEEFEKAMITYKPTKKGEVAKVILLFKSGDYELENKLPPEFTIHDESFFSTFEEFLKSKDIVLEIKRK